MATLNDVAKLAGVSPATVSRVLNRSVVVSESTRERVLNAAKELSYELPQVSHPSGDKIILVVSDISNPERSQAFYRSIADAGYQMLQFYYCEGPETEQDLFRFLQSYRSLKISGILLDNFVRPIGSALLAELNRYPVVQLSGRCPLDRMISVDLDSYQAGFEATRILIERGAKRIALFHSAGSYQIMDQQRLNGYYSALNQYGIVPDPSLLLDIDFLAENSFSRISDLIDSGEKLPDAFICPLDFVAITCLQVLTNAGYKVPDQIQLISLKESWNCQFSSPPLTTIEYPIPIVCSEAVSLLQRLIRGEDLRSQHIGFQGVFHMRQSTR